MKVVALSESLPALGGGERYALSLLAPLAGANEVTVCYRGGGGPVDPARVRGRFGLDVGGLEFRPYRSAREVHRLAAGADLFVNATYGSIAPNPAPLGVLAVFFPLPLADYPRPRPAARPGQYLEACRQWILGRLEGLDPDAFGAGVSDYRRRRGLARAAGRLPLFALRKLAWAGYRDLRLGARAVRSYTRVLAISEYTARWVGRYYGCRTEMLYPPVEVGAYRAGVKAAEVLAVGRFDDGENSKRFDILVDAFKRARGEGLLAGWTLHLCGGADDRAGPYLRRLRAQAAGHPVEFHPNLPHPELVRRYASASLFWHAMGYGADPERHPWRCEHFGMTTAEAMAAGCVPMVINAGGQPEIVSRPDAGYLWDTPDDLIQAVRDYLALPPDRAAAMGRAARACVGRFDYPGFIAGAADLYRRLGVPHRPPEAVLPRLAAGAP